ncbi:MAG: DUF3800 domain-containing protein [Cyanobacteria bacterium REEB65]|nr:DUF3800 domain-containing protein [Cyanobacteria bacterium REEB65]
MAPKYLFTDEAGNFDFSGGPGASRYFLLTTMTLADCQVGSKLLSLKRELVLHGVPDVREHFHATEDKQHVRNRVFGVIREAAFRLDCTIFEKAKAPPFKSDEHFYRAACLAHFEHVLAGLPVDDELLLVSASLGTRGRKVAFALAFREAVGHHAPAQHQTAFWPAASEPCIQAVDYCSWAFQRKWERGDSRSYEIITDKVASERHVWQDEPIAKG